MSKVHADPLNSQGVPAESDSGVVVGGPDMSSETVDGGTYTSHVVATQPRIFLRPEVLNKILLVLGFIGIFDAGLLSAEAGLRMYLSCGTNGGCAAVASHPSAFWFGIPVAYFGLAGYAAFTVLAAIRMIVGVGKYPVLVKLGYGMAAFGALVSVYLQYTALVVIGAFCPYCFGSAVNMFLTLGAYAMLARALPSSEPTPQPGSGSWIGVGVLSTAVAVYLGVSVLQASAPTTHIVPLDVLKNVTLIPKTDLHSYGDPKSPITVVEFADLCCIHCQILTPKMHQFVDLHPGKIWTIYRHFPLISAHKQAVAAALVSEYAASKGKFWEYALRLMSPQAEPLTTDNILAPAEELHLDTEAIRKKLTDTNDPIYTPVTRDMNDAQSLGVNSTPTFFIIAPGLQTKVSVAANIFDALSKSPYKEILDKK